MALLQSSGKLTLLRGHDVGTKFGPPTDQIDVEAAVQLSTTGTKAFGFTGKQNGRLTRVWLTK